MNRELFHPHILASMTIFMFYSIPTTCTNVSFFHDHREKGRLGFFFFAAILVKVTGFLGGRKKSCNISFLLQSWTGTLERKNPKPSDWVFLGGGGIWLPPSSQQHCLQIILFPFQKSRLHRVVELHAYFIQIFYTTGTEHSSCYRCHLCITTKGVTLSTYEMNTKLRKRWLGKGTK